MDEEKNEAVESEQGEKGNEKKEKKPKAAPATEKIKGMGAFVSLQFLTFFIVIGVVILQYIQFEKVSDISKQLIEKDLIDEGKEDDEGTVPDIDLSQVDLIPLGTQNVYNIKDGTKDKMLLLTVNLGLNKKAKSYKKVVTLLTEKLEVVKETVATIICSHELSTYENSNDEYKVKTEIIKELNKLFSSDCVVKVYFSDKLIS